MKAMALGTDSPRARATDPTTSHEAADATADKVAASEEAVYGVLLDALMPLTDEEIHSYLKHEYSPSRVRSARRDLERKGRIHSTGTVTPPGKRTRCRTWEVTK